MHQFFFKKQLVLIGGGHANIQVLKKLCMNEYNSLNTILISDSYSAIYSGMVPGYLCKDFSFNEISIDLQRLCYNAGATFIKDKIINLDNKLKKIKLKNNPSILYDILSINTGSVSKIDEIKIDKKANVILVKPISQLIHNLKKIDKIVEESSKQKIVIIGGGVAAFEISFALRQRYSQKVSIKIIKEGNKYEKNLNLSTISRIKKISKAKNISIHHGKVKSILKSELILHSGKRISSDISIISTGADLPKWLKKVPIDKLDNFLAVNNYLQLINDENIFAVGDVMTLQRNKITKSGVIAVRQGEILKDNIFLKFENKSLKKYIAQKNWLYLITTGKKTALINYYNFSFEGKIFWHLKKLIDKNFMNKFILFKNDMGEKKIHNFKSHSIESMYCQGCGSKVSKNSLKSYLSENNLNTKLDDSTILKISKKELLQTIDHIKLFKSLNPYIFGKISYLHSQNDILSGGGKVNSLNVSVGIPFSEDKTEKFFLNYFMKGIQSELDNDNSFVTAGHSYQTNEPGITIHMNGYIKKKLDKSLAKTNDLIYLSKPLGTGYLLSAYFQNTNLISSKEFNTIIDYMLLSNKEAASAAIDSNCSVITDISGFGLASHLGDICESSKLSASISLNKDLLINPNLDLLEKFKSTGFKNNYQSSIEKIRYVDLRREFKILFDPQTNGPLLIVINQNFKENFEKTFKEKVKRTPILIGKLIKKQNTLINII